MQRIMDPKVRAAMAAVAPMREDSTLEVEYPGQDAIPPELRLRVQFREFSDAARRLQAKAYAEDPKAEVSLELALACISEGDRNGVVGWENMFDKVSLLDKTKDPLEIEFSKESLKKIDDKEFVFWCFDKVHGLTWVRDQEGLESSPPLTPKKSRKAAKIADVPQA